MAMHPLSRPTAWSLKAGGASVPAIKWVGALLWAAAALVALVWLIGVVQDAFAGQLAAWVGAAGTLAVLAWFALAWQMALRWLAQSGSLTLTWHGPVRAPDPTRREALPEGGFHVSEWRSSVQVHVVCDWQHWMLLRLRAARSSGAPRQAFCWVAMQDDLTARRAGANAPLHQLRTLLYLPSAWTTQEGDQPSASLGQGRHPAKPVASWAALLSSGSKLPSPAKRLSPNASREADTLFPQTELLDDSDACEHAIRKGMA